MVMAVLAVVVLFLTVRAIVRRDRHAAEVRGLRSEEEYRAEDQKAREEFDDMMKPDRPHMPGGL